MVQSGSKAIALFQPFLQRFRAMEGEDFSGTGLGISAICESGNDTGTLIEERQGFVVADPFQLGTGIAFGLVFYGGDVFAFAFALGFDNANRFLIYKQHIVCWANICLIFPDRLSLAFIQINLVFVLHTPACPLE